MYLLSTCMYAERNSYVILKAEVADSRLDEVNFTILTLLLDSLHG
jgi:hypothetical protein